MIAEPFIKVPRFQHLQRMNFLPESVTICTKTTEAHYEFLARIMLFLYLQPV